MRPQHVRIAQLSISGLSLAFGVAIMGTAGNTLQVYRSQYASNPWWLPLWNSHFDVRGTNTLVGAGATVVVTNLIFLFCCLFPKFNLTERTTLRAFVTLALAFPAVVVTFGAVIFVHVLNKNSPEIETIQTWTCKFKGKKAVSTAGATTSVSSSISNDQFDKLCTESKFALYTTLVVFLLQGTMLVVAVLGWCVEKWVARKQKKHWNDVGSLELNSRGGSSGGGGVDYEKGPEPTVSVHTVPAHY